MNLLTQVDTCQWWLYCSSSHGNLKISQRTNREDWKKETVLLFKEWVTNSTYQWSKCLVISITFNQGFLKLVVNTSTMHDIAQRNNSSVTWALCKVPPWGERSQRLLHSRGCHLLSVARGSGRHVLPWMNISRLHVLFFLTSHMLTWKHSVWIDDL